MYSASEDVFKLQYTHSTPALRSLYLIQDDYVHPHTATSLSCYTDTFQLFLELSEVPPTLWESHKYDVGLIRSAEPVSIKAKSNFRPNQPQYPLKLEAIEGIKHCLVIVNIWSKWVEAFATKSQTADGFSQQNF